MKMINKGNVKEDENIFCNRVMSQNRPIAPSQIIFNNYIECFHLFSCPVDKLRKFKGLPIFLGNERVFLNSTVILEGLIPKIQPGSIYITKRFDYLMVCY